MSRFRVKNRGKYLDRMDIAFVVFSVVPVLKTLSNKTMELGSFPVSFSCHRNFPSGCYCCCSSPSFSSSSSFSSSFAIVSTIRESHDHGILATQISKCYFPYFFFFFATFFFNKDQKRENGCPCLMRDSGNRSQLVPCSPIDICVG